MTHHSIMSPFFIDCKTHTSHVNVASPDSMPLIFLSWFFFPLWHQWKRVTPPENIYFSDVSLSLTSYASHVLPQLIPYILPQVLLQFFPWLFFPNMLLQWTQGWLINQRYWLLLWWTLHIYHLNGRYSTMTTWTALFNIHRTRSHQVGFFRIMYDPSMHLVHPEPWHLLL